MEEQLFPKANAVPMGGAIELTSLASRVKLVEERYDNLSKRNRLSEDTLLTSEREVRAEIRALSAQVVELRRKLSEVNGKIDTMLGELDGLARKHDVAVVERYIDLWQPVRFLTREEAKRVLEVKHG